MATVKKPQTEILPGAVLAGKLARVRGEVKRLKKTGHNKFDNYTFATEGDVSDMIRDLLAGENIDIAVSMVDPPIRREFQSRKGNPMMETLQRFEISFICGDTGYERISSWYGEAADRGDKGINKTATAAVKYFLLKTFLISTGDSVDADREETEDRVPKKASADAEQVLARAQSRLGEIEKSGSLEDLREFASNLTKFPKAKMQLSDRYVEVKAAVEARAANHTGNGASQNPETATGTSSDQTDTEADRKALALSLCEKLSTIKVQKHLQNWIKKHQEELNKVCKDDAGADAIKEAMDAVNKRIQTELGSKQQELGT